MAVIISDSGNAKYGTAVATVAIGAAGSGYTVNDVLTINSGDTNATVTVSSVDGSGGVTGITRTAVGSGYSAGTYGVTGGTGSSATITVTIQAGLGTVNGFYRVEAHNLSPFSTTGLALTTTRYISVTFANAGNCQGLLLYVYASTNTNRQVKVALQENTGSWVERVAVTLTSAQIASSMMSTPHGEYLVPFEFATPYAVDTTGSKWRFEISHATGTGSWNLATSDATNPFYATWCDNAVSFADNDVLIVKDKILIDKTATLGAVLGTGDTTNGIAGIVCPNIADPTPANVALLEWENPPLASYTFTVNGKVLMGGLSGLRIGTSTNRIPVAQQAIWIWGAPAVGTATSGIQGKNTATSYTYSLQSLFLYGEIPTYQKTFLTQDAATGQAVLNVSDSVDWVNGDSVVVGKQDTQGQGVTTIHTVSSVSGTEITLTSNLATNTRKSGGSVIRLNGYGIVMKNNSTYTYNYTLTPANFQISGVEFGMVAFYLANTTSYWYLNFLDATCRSQYLIQDVTARSSSSTPYTFINNITIPIDGALIQRVYLHRMSVGPVYDFYRSIVGSTFSSGRLTIRDCIFQSIYSSGVGIGYNTSRLSIHDNIFENSRASGAFYYMLGINSEFYNNVCWGHGIALGSVIVGQCINPIKIENNKFNKCAVAVGFGAYTSAKCVDEGSIFGDEAANTTDIVWATGAAPDYLFKDVDTPVGGLVFDETYLPDMVVGTKLAFENYDEVANDDKTVYTYGKIQRTGDGLTDTTVRTSGTGKFAMRVEPLDSTNNFDFIFDVPTGNIQNLTMALSVWVKMNNAAYYAGTHQNPKLTVTYDTDSTITDTATDTTDWQLLSVVFTPTTTAGKITVTLSFATDATSTNRYVYVDDFSVLYPAGSQLNLGGLDVWSGGLPVLPPISTNISALDVWSVSKSTTFGSGSMGEQVASKLLSTNKFIALK